MKNLSNKKRSACLKIRTIHVNRVFKILVVHERPGLAVLTFVIAAIINHVKRVAQRIKINDVSNVVLSKSLNIAWEWLTVETILKVKKKQQNNIVDGCRGC